MLFGGSCFSEQVAAFGVGSAAAHGSDVAHFDLHRSQHGGDIEFRAVHKDADSSHSDPLLLAVRCCGLYM